MLRHTADDRKVCMLMHKTIHIKIKVLKTIKRMTDRAPELAHAPACQGSSQGQALSQKAEQNFIALNKRSINGFPLGLDINMQLVFYRVQLLCWYDYLC